MSLEQIANGKLTMTVDEVAKALKIGRAQAYAAVRAKQIPSIRFGKRLLVPVAALKAMLERPA